LQFRKDINGLRAVAVIAVVLFHFNASWMPGGFAGVDVFFVISGFLMTGIIFRGLDKRNFSILNFYVARANRIIPALGVLCFVLLLFGWFYLSPLDYRSLGKHVAGSMGFLSNILYWKELGYFDAAAHEKWLLHTWSLSAEWQFYVIYPLVLVAMRKIMSLKSMKITVLFGTVLGFIYCVIITYKWPNLSYYLLPTRAWEMMLGGIAYLYPMTLNEKGKKVVEWVGLSLIFTSYFLISKESPWPGYLAIFPVLGSFLIIQAQRDDSFITSNIVFQKIGVWSYSIYLWHWPLVVAIYYFSLDEVYVYAGILLSILLGYLSNRYVEKIKFKNIFDSTISYLKCKPLYIAIIMGLLGIVVFKKYGVISPLRFNTEIITVVDQQIKNPRESSCGRVRNGISPSCIYGKGPLKAIVIGDSHAQAQIAGIGKRAMKFGGSVLDWGLSGCNTIKGLYSVNQFGKNPDYNCGKLVSNAIDISAKKYSGIPVIIINKSSHNLYSNNGNVQPTAPNRFVDRIFSERNSEYSDNLSGHMINTICEFTQSNPVYLVRPIPEMSKDIVKTMFKSLHLSGKNTNIKITLIEYAKRQELVIKMQDEAVKRCGAKILNPIPYLCDSTFCYGDISGVPLYFDGDHLSSYGTDVILPMYDKVFKLNSDTSL